MTDYHNPRLAKFVTEAAPIEMVSNMQGSTYGDLEKYPMRVRIGSGWQFLRDDKTMAIILPWRITTSPQAIPLCKVGRTMVRSV